MGGSSGSSTSTTAPWGPAVPNLQFGLNELNRAYAANMPLTTSSGAPVLNSNYGAVQTGTPMPSFMRGGPAETFKARYFNNRYFNGQNSNINLGYDNNTAIMSVPRNGGGNYQLGGGMNFPGMNMGGGGGPQINEYGLANLGAGELAKTIRGDYLMSNPYLDEMIRRASADVNSQFAGAGRYGSGAHEQGLFERAAMPFRYQDYANERARQMGAIQAAPGYDLAPYQLFGARTAAPYENVRNYLELANSVAGRGGSTSTPIYRNPLASAAGGALAGSAFGPWGAAIGGGIGLIGGLG